MRDLPRIVAETPVGAEVVVKVMRDGKPLEIKVTLGRLEKAEEMRKAAKEKAKPEAAEKTKTLLGMKLGPLDEAARKKHKIPEKVKKGVVVLSVKAGTDAEKKGLAAGDVILEAGNVEVSTPAGVEKQIEAFRKKGRKAIPFLVLRKAAGYDPRFIALWLKK